MLFPMMLMTAMMAGTSASDVSNLMQAIEDGNIDKVKVLLNTVRVTSKDESGRSVMHAAVYSDGEIIRFLITRGARAVINDKFNMGCITDVTPLLLACLNMQFSQMRLYEIIEAILKAGGDPNVSTSDLLITPLHVTTRGPEARLLISYGADVNAKDKCGRTPAFTYFCWLHRRKKSAEFFYALVDGNADLSITNDFGDTIFHMKSEGDAYLWTKEFVAFLARNGVPLDALNVEGETPLTYDINLYFEEIYESMTYENFGDSFVAYMAEAGANLSAANQRGETPLHLAALKHHAGMAKWLLDNGADVEAKKADGDPPLLALIKQEIRNYVESDYSLPSKDETDKVRAVIDVLVEGGADVNFVDEFGPACRLLLAEIDKSLLGCGQNYLKIDTGKK